MSNGAADQTTPATECSTPARYGWSLACASLLLFAAYPAAAGNSTVSGSPAPAFDRRDLQGAWTNSSLTSFERDPAYGERAVMTPGEVSRLESQRQAQVAGESTPTDQSATAEEINGKCEVRGYKGGPACGYNGAWTDPGDTVMRVSGQPRTSFITSTPDGRVPKAIGLGATSSRPPVPAGMKDSDNPETRSLGERCLMSFGYSSGPVMLPQLYNSNYQFVQTPGELAIVVEMVHDVRHIRIGARHRADGVRPWMGDSIGWWEGDDLVAETTSFNPQQHFLGASPALKVTERFTRVGRDRLLYRFTVDDPNTWSRPWSGEYEFGVSKGPIYEYACHEGNYGLVGILSGARAEEAKDVTGSGVTPAP